MITKQLLFFVNSGLNVIYIDIVFGRDLFAKPVELTVSVSFRRNYLCNSDLPLINNRDI